MRINVFIIINIFFLAVTSIAADELLVKGESRGSGLFYRKILPDYTLKVKVVKILENEIQFIEEGKNTIENISLNKLIKISYDSGEVIIVKNLLEEKKKEKEKKKKIEIINEIENSDYLFLPYISTPLNILPQVGLGIGQNTNWVLNFGLRAGISLSLTDFFYAEASVYMNLKVFSILLDMPLRYIGLSVSSKYISYSKDSSRGESNLSDISVYLGWEKSRFNIDIGYSISIKRHDKKPYFEGLSDERQKEYQYKIKQIENNMNIFYKISRFYFCISYKIPISYGIL
ncbi:MAG: hypothetical protein OEZ22_11415 [Spirochaetia bacterium]|nr:hypothetical protein [Spirochaetia bacterium]